MRIDLLRVFSLLLMVRLEEEKDEEDEDEDDEKEEEEVVETLAKSVVEEALRSVGKEEENREEVEAAESVPVSLL